MIAAATMILCAATLSAGRTYNVASPDGKINVTVNAGKDLNWAVDADGVRVLAPSAMSMTLADGDVFGRDVKVKKAKENSVRDTFKTPFYKKAEVKNDYNQLTLTCADGYSVQFRVYDDGAAYRFVSDRKKGLTVKDELAEFNFASDHEAFIPYINDNRGGDKYSYSFESYYDRQPISRIYADSLAITPLLVDLDGGMRVAVMDNAVDDYPGMFLVKDNGKPYGLKGSFAPEITDGHWGGHMKLNYISDTRADHIAKADGKQTFPWRTVLIARDDMDLLDNDMAQRLAPECVIEDTSWIRPGKVAWDWWNTTNLSGVDFKAGMNTDTYKYFIDFAAANGLEYIIIDCGWSSGKADDWKEESLMICNPDIDLPAIIAHGKEKGVGVILWASWAACDAEKTTAFPHYAEMGVKGFKVDFLDRDDQMMIRSMEEIVKCAAENKLLIDLHGMRPTGIQRKYPNVVNFEGVKGLENCKWAAMDGDRSATDFCEYDVTIPYIRMLSGPMDYTPGAMTNKARNYFRPVNDHPMSQGTRVHQMAMYTVYEAPLQMLSDSPSAYMKNQECTDFIAGVPTTFDETVPLAGKVGEYVAVARRKGDTWWIGAMNNWDRRNLTIDFSFLPKGKKYRMEVFQDGVNSDVEATDYKRLQLEVDSETLLHTTMAPGGGWTARLY